MSDDFDLEVFQINEELVIVNLEAETMVSVVSRLSDLLVDNGYVKPSYQAAALEREHTCPTGLPTPGLGTAIPHAGVEHTLKPGIAVATLVKPVKFGQLGDPETQIDISVVFMLSVTKPDAQVYLLQSLVEIYKDEELLRRVHAAATPGAVVKEINAALARVNSHK